MRRRQFAVIVLPLLAAPALLFASSRSPTGKPAPLHWSFRPLTLVSAPGGAANPIDAFVRAKLREKGLSLSPPAANDVLLRRLSLDLTGLPPSPEEVARFVADRAPNAHERLIDRLLASERFGEKWARHWLDLARYAESEGFKADEHRPNAWRYRDYVIRSLNADKPFDRFLKEQIAGDELWPNDPDSLIATGFLRHWADESNARNLRLRRQEILNDVTDVTASVFLGLTVACARCHDHKTDPVSQKDYYRLQAYFAAMRPRDDIPLSSEAERDVYGKRLAIWEEQTRDLRAELEALGGPVRKKLYRSKWAKFPEETQQAVDTPAEKRTALQWALFRKAEPQLAVSQDEVKGALPKDELKRWESLQKSLDAFGANRPAELPVAQGVTDLGPFAPDTHKLRTGVYDAPLERVKQGTPPALSSSIRGTEARAVPGRETTGRRAALADWLASPRNPLTARVIVNRIWAQYFGAGLVETASDFGRMGERPSHPELLDWLASELVRSGWKLKRIHRLIVTSETYRQSSALNRRAAKLDPENRLLWRFLPRRMEGETIRDALLAVSGSLNLKAGGPSVVPHLPAGSAPPPSWKPNSDAADQNRRSIYLYVKRNLRYPLFVAFDMPDTHEPCARRATTTTSTQALALMNGELALEAARNLSERTLREAGQEPKSRIGRLYRIAYGRPPKPGEVGAAMEFLREAEACCETSDPSSPSPDAWTDLAHAVLVSSEFLYVR